VRTETSSQFLEDNSEMRQFVEMCFGPNSPMNDRLKQIKKEIALMNKVLEAAK